MFKRQVSCFMAVAFIAVVAADPKVKLETTCGDIVVQLDSSAAPKTVANFLEYVNSGFYDGTTFHRVIRKFMIQGGGFTPDMTQKPTRPPVANEANNGLLNLRGTIAMARTSNPHSATAQFFINTVDNQFLNHTATTRRGWGYCVFGNVIRGMETVDSIAKTPTTRTGMHSDVPAKPVLIKRAVAIKAKRAVR